MEKIEQIKIKKCDERKREALDEGREVDEEGLLKMHWMSSRQQKKRRIGRGGGGTIPEDEAK